MWQRVRGQIDRDLQALSPKIYTLRPAMIMPMHGIVSRTPSYRVLYALLKPFMGLLRSVRPALVTTSDELAQVMIHVARYGHSEAIIESAAFAPLAQMS
ncbi:MAG: hypothetical protein EOO77_45450 [Oxalobacteraceae bacterium]|nr:MAG: hypothetical protein EOO77_45450 [Oxalobacteraceae bacterium]